MKRSLSIERVYTLGNYKSIRFIDTIEDIPEELAMNQEYLDEIRMLQMVNVERHYRDYIEMNKQINELSLEDSIVALDEFKDTTLEDIQIILNKKED